MGMIKKLILISGPVSSGKSTLSQGLADRFGFAIYRTREWLSRRLRGNSPDRTSLQNEGDRLDVQTRGRWVLEELTKELPAQSNGVVILDSVRTKDQIEALRDAFGPSVTHIHVTAPLEVLQKRYDQRRKRERRDLPTYQDVRQNQTEQQVDSLQAVADIVVDTNRCTSEDALVRAASHLRLYGNNSAGYVDVLVGGQYGSEGKGQIAGYISKEYDLLVRVGGPNAGHKVYEHPEPYTHHLLPSGTRKSDAELLIGPGAVLDLTVLLSEIAECQVDVERLRIDRHAIIITEQDKADEGDLVQGIGSTGQGVGAATARRVMQRKADTLLAQGVPDLRPYRCDALEVLDATLSRNGRVLLEGTQGTGLSLYHGFYPYVTSRDTTVSGCLAEAGISPSRVRKVLMVCRTYPIRVQNPKGGTSGPMSQELTWEEVARRSGQDVRRLRQTERTSTTNRMRRIGEFDWVLLRRAALLNGPTDIALTFTDYLSSANGAAKRIEQLQPETISFIHEVERVAGANVSLIATGFNSRSIIDRRAW
jgi:adenylosuccinate synthase